MEIVLTRFAEARKGIESVRNEVFGQEQGVAPEIDWDGKDDQCQHVAAVKAGAETIGTGRLAPDGKIGRLAVLRAYRGQGVGRAMLEQLVSAAEKRGLERVFLHAQTHALAFYESAGFVAEGEVFVEAEIEHVLMARACSRSLD